MNIDELPSLLNRLETQDRDRASVIRRLEGQAAEQEAMRAMVLEISTALADMMQMMEKAGPETARAIVAGLKELKLTAAAAQPINVDAPVTVNVPQTPVQVDAPVTVNVPPAPPPVIHLIEKAGKKHGGWKFDLETDNFGNLKSMTATPL